MAIELECTLTRGKGSPIPATTIDLVLPTRLRDDQATFVGGQILPGGPAGAHSSASNWAAAHIDVASGAAGVPQQA